MSNRSEACPMGRNALSNETSTTNNSKRNWWLSVVVLLPSRSITHSTLDWTDASLFCLLLVLFHLAFFGYWRCKGSWPFFCLVRLPRVLRRRSWVLVAAVCWFRYLTCSWCCLSLAQIHKGFERTFDANLKHLRVEQQLRKCDCVWGHNWDVIC